MRLWKILTLGLLVTTCWVAPGLAQARGGMHDAGLAFSWRLLRALNLSDTQKAGVHDAFAAFRTTIRTTVKPLWEEVLTARQHLTDLLLSPTAPDPTDLQNTQQQIVALQGSIAQARMAAQTNLGQTIRSVLTADQLAQATQIVAQIRASRANVQQLLTPTQP